MQVSQLIEVTMVCLFPLLNPIDEVSDHQPLAVVVLLEAMNADGQKITHEMTC